MWYYEYMTQIKSIVFCARRKLKTALKNTGFEFSNDDFGPYFFDFIHHLIPLKFKFLKESFVALQNNKIQGLITLEKDEKSKTKLKISKLFLEKNSYDAGKLLVQYVLSRYCAMGALSYRVVVDENQQDLLSLFITGCGFYENAFEYMYQISSESASKFSQISPEGFAFFKTSCAQEVCELFNRNINSYQRYNFARTPEQFDSNFAQGISCDTHFAYVLQDESQNKIYGYFIVSTRNNKDYVLDFVMDKAFEVYFDDALAFIISSLNKRNKNWNLFIKIKSYFINYERFKNNLEEHNFTLVKTSKILTKDFLAKQKEMNILNSAKIVFNDITPAFKNSN